jgi:hypothetical protein
MGAPRGLDPYMASQERHLVMKEETGSRSDNTNFRIFPPDLSHSIFNFVLWKILDAKFCSAVEPA